MKLSCVYSPTMTLSKLYHLALIEDTVYHMVARNRESFDESRRGSVKAKVWES